MTQKAQKDTKGQQTLPPDPIHMPSGSKVMKKTLHFAAELFP